MFTVEVAVGVAFTVLSFGTSDAIAGSAAAATVAAAVDAAEAAIATVTVLFGSLAGVAAELATLFVVGFGVDLGAQSVASAIVYPDHNPFVHLDFEAMLIAGGSFAALGPLVKGLGLFSSSSALVEGTVQIGGLAAASAGLSALSQEIKMGKLDPGELLFAGIVGGAGGAFGLDSASAVSLQRELDSQGMAYDPEQILFIGRSDDTQRIVFLEKGDFGSGASHIIVEHGADFVGQGVADSDYLGLVFSTAKDGTILIDDGSGRFIYSYVFNGQTRYMQITIGENGYIVGANPLTREYVPKAN